MLDDLKTHFNKMIGLQSVDVKQLVQKTVQQALSTKSDTQSSQLVQLMEQAKVSEQRNIELMDIIEEYKVQVKTLELTGKA